MKALRMAFIFVFAGLLLFISSGPGQSKPAAEELLKDTGMETLTYEPDNPWIDQLIDDNSDVGASVSMAITPDQKTIYLSYYDRVKGDLRFAWYIGHSGSCGENGEWGCGRVDGDGAAGGLDVGMNGTIDINPLTGFPGIAYYDKTNHRLKYAAYRCDSVYCGWEITAIAYVGDLAPGAPSSRASLKFDSAGKPHIGYTTEYTFPGGDSLTYATTDPVNGNCDLNNGWRCDKIQDASETGQYPDLSIGSTGQVYIAYYDGLNGDLEYAFQHLPNQGNCGPANSWKCLEMDTVGDVGRSPSLHLSESANDTTGIAYYDATNGRLKYLYPKSGGNCGDGNWQCDVIDDTLGSVDTPVAVSLTTTSSGDPLIAYHCPTCAGTSIKLAHRVFLGGNCGPNVSFPPFLIRTWSCSTILSGQSAGQTLGEYSDITLNPADLATIVYYDSLNGDLRQIHQLIQVFLPGIIR